jgi:hypothetical protein
MTTRIAVSVVLICVGVMLLSACGLSMLIPPRQPELVTNTLVLWDMSQGSTPTPLGLLRLSGPANHIDASLVVKEPNCLKDEKIYLTGTVVKSHSPELTLTQKPDQPEFLQLQAKLPPQPMVYRIDAAPSNGSISFGSGCASAKIYQFQARDFPKLLGTWRGSAATPQQAAIVETIYWEHPTRYDIPQATVELRHDACFLKGETTSAVELPSVPQHFTLTFKMDANAILTADTTVDVLTRNTPLITRYSVKGGACDGQTFTAILHER